MDPSIYFTFFLGLLAVCIVGSVLRPPAMRNCPACDERTRVDGRRCRHCGYSFTQG